MFSINTAPEKFEKVTITVHFRFSLRLRKLERENHKTILTSWLSIRKALF